MRFFLILYFSKRCALITKNEFLNSKIIFNNKELKQKTVFFVYLEFNNFNQTKEFLLQLNYEHVVCLKRVNNRNKKDFLLMK